MKDFVLSWHLPKVYARAAKSPLSPTKVVFLEQIADKSLSDNFQVMYDRLDQGYDFDLHVIFFERPNTASLRSLKSCRAMLREIATAKYVFQNDASHIVSCVKLREETKVVQLWHGCGAFKRFGMGTADLLFGGSRKEQLRHPLYKNYSLVTVSSPEVVWAYVESMVLEDRPEIVRPLGVSRTDVFFDQEFLSQARKEVLGSIPGGAGKKVILYAPTFRGRVAAALPPDRLDIQAFKDALGDDYVLLIKHHPHVKTPPPIPSGCQDFAFLVSPSVSIDALLAVADLCISDYSSLVFEYSLFERPMIFFAYDLVDYEDWRGFYYPYNELTPGPVLTTNEEMIAYIKDIDNAFDKQEVVDFKGKFMGSCDGRATERICEEVFGQDLEQYRKPVAYEALSRQAPDGKDISVIVPVHNGMPELTKTLQSLTEQTYPRDRIEAIIVDDGSTDGTWEEIQRFVHAYPRLFVGKRLDAPTGSPAKPRNAALGMATGAYLFFLDADDWLGKQAVEKMLDHAVGWGSDVLYVKMVGTNGRSVPRSMFTHNQPKVDLYASKVLWSIGPLKLYRHELVESHALRFFEGGMPEDLSFFLSALLAAETVSVASDYDYYYCGWREKDGQNTSLAIWDDLGSNFAAYEALLGFIDKNIAEGDRNRILMHRLFKIDVRAMLESVLKNYPGAQGDEYCRRIAALFSPYYVEPIREKFKFRERLIFDSGLSGDRGLLEAVTDRVSAASAQGPHAKKITGVDRVKRGLARRAYAFAYRKGLIPKNARGSAFVLWLLPALVPVAETHDATQGTPSAEKAS